MNPETAANQAQPGRSLSMRREGRCLHVVLCNPEAGNPLNRRLIDDLHAVMDSVEQDTEISLIVLAAQGAVFCDGMDFGEALATSGNAEQALHHAVHRFHDLLDRMTRIPVIVASLVEGRVNAGGMGLVAACDLVLASETADFGLSEVLFGLLPATVTPFLVRRVGFQAVYRMALTAQRMTAKQALACGLVDEMTEQPTDSLRRLRIRADRLQRPAVARIKTFYADFAAIGPDSAQRAERALAALLSDGQVAATIKALLSPGNPL